MNQKLSTVLSWLTALLVPVFLIGLGMRILLTPLYPAVEYRMPGFPPDDYGFSLDERLHWSRYAIDYLNNSAGPEYLGDLRFDDGAPVFTEREVSHMHDVKVVSQGGLTAWAIVTGALILLGVWAWRGKWDQAYWSGLRRGGWITLGLVAAILVFALTSFWNFFAAFHSLFFTGDSWLFQFSDTLIRLFPLRFWQDVFIAEGLLVVGGALGLALGLKPKRS
jgi:integral membrane protein (TIGR01906 family)